jgi:hypothetical protein
MHEEDKLLKAVDAKDLHRPTKMAFRTYGRPQWSSD